MAAPPPAHPLISFRQEEATNPPIDLDAQSTRSSQTQGMRSAGGRSVSFSGGDLDGILGATSKERQDQDISFRMEKEFDTFSSGQSQRAINNGGVNPDQADWSRIPTLNGLEEEEEKPKKKMEHPLLPDLFPSDEKSKSKGHSYNCNCRGILKHLFQLIMICASVYGCIWFASPKELELVRYLTARNCLPVTWDEYENKTVAGHPLDNVLFSMTNYLERSGAIGVSAMNLGVPSCISQIKSKEGRIITLINMLEMGRSSDKVITAEKSTLCPNQAPIHKERCRQVKYEYLEVDGTFWTTTFAGNEASVLQHLDDLQRGISICQK